MKNPDKTEKELTQAEENFQKNNVSPYPLIIQMKSNRTRSARKEKQRRKRLVNAVN